MRHIIHKVTQQNLTRLQNISKWLLLTKSLNILTDLYNTFRTKAYCHSSFLLTTFFLILKSICDRAAKIESKLGIFTPSSEKIHTHTQRQHVRERIYTDGSSSLAFKHFCLDEGFYNHRTICFRDLSKQTPHTLKHTAYWLSNKGTQDRISKPLWRVNLINLAVWHLSLSAVHSSTGTWDPETVQQTDTNFQLQRHLWKTVNSMEIQLLVWHTSQVNPRSVFVTQ